MKSRVLFGLAALSILCACSSGGPSSDSSFADVHNDCFWNANGGVPLYSQGGGIFRFFDERVGRERYFWYGMRYAECALYRENPVKIYNGCTFDAVSLYTSDDLVHWDAEPDVFTKDEVAKMGRYGWLGRMGVAKIGNEELYAIFIQYNASVLVATAESPLGPFANYRVIDMTSRIGTSNTGDQTVFTDFDGKSYLIYSYGKGRSRGYISEIGREAGSDSIGLKNCVEVFHGASREGNCMFRRGNKYYLCASNIYGWNASDAYYLVADSIYGPYLPENDMQIMINCEDDYAHVTQTGFFVTVQGSEQETVIYCGDRWANFANNGLGYNQWVPLSFTSDGLPVFNSLSHWQLNEKTGEWRVGCDNNYVLNPSFEADRRIIPLAVKPRQEFLSGWKTEVLAGTQIGVDVPHSPHLNIFNSEEDQAFVVGKMSMLISDSVAFQRKVSQVVESRGDVPFEHGTYSFGVFVNATEGFSSLRVTVGDVSHDLNSVAGMGWQKVSFPVEVSADSLVISFEAEGAANASCRIDDVELKRM